MNQSIREDSNKNKRSFTGKGLMLPLHLPKKVLDRHPPHHAYVHMIQTEKPGQPLPAFER